MAGLFTVDGVSYKVRVPAGGLTRSFQVLDGKNAGRLRAARPVNAVSDAIRRLFARTLYLPPDTRKFSTACAKTLSGIFSTDVDDPAGQDDGNLRRLAPKR